MATKGGRRARQWIAALAMTATALVSSAVLASPAMASPATDLASATNNARIAAGLPPLAVTAQLTAVAQAWANHLAAANALSHNGQLRVQVTDWSVLGENVGVAGDIPTVQAAFMASAPHKANILNTSYTQMGVASATSIYPGCGCQVLWVVIDFRRPMTVSTVAPVKPAPVKHVTPKPVVKVVTVTPKIAIAPKVAIAPKAAAHVTSATPSATTLQTDLAASTSPNTAGSNPVGRMLNFATVMSRLPN
jgi:uncharacterized protein YkwD